MKMKKASEMVANDYGIMIKKCCGSGATLLPTDWQACQGLCSVRRLVDERRAENSGLRAW